MLNLQHEFTYVATLKPPVHAKVSGKEAFFAFATRHLERCRSRGTPPPQPRRDARRLRGSEAGWGMTVTHSGDFPARRFGVYAFHPSKTTTFFPPGVNSSVGDEFLRAAESAPRPSGLNSPRAPESIWAMLSPRL